MSYIVMVECRDCTGQDDYGCGDGNPWYIAPWPEAGRREASRFSSREKAEAAISEYSCGEPWDYTIIEVNP